MSGLFEYHLPPHLIAQHPAARRDASRLMELDRNTGAIRHHFFRDLPTLLHPGDLLVLNDTRVLPARLLGRRADTGGKWEGLFLHADADGCWEMLCQTKGHPTAGERFIVEPGPLSLTLEGKRDGHWLMRPDADETPEAVLQRVGQLPLPPYIRKGRASPEDTDRYQTVYAKYDGSVAAPTAGLHFTDDVFAALSKRGIATTTVTLHVGLGTFQPIRGDDPEKHVMHGEWASVPEATVAAIRDCKARGGRVVAVGTTATRALETASASGTLQPWQGISNLYIRPPYTFNTVDALITNFHLPGTTLLLLVGALAGMEHLRDAYATAVREEYRFYSYGDAMLIHGRRDG